MSVGIATADVGDRRSAKVRFGGKEVFLPGLGKVWAEANYITSSTKGKLGNNLNLTRASKAVG